MIGSSKTTFGFDPRTIPDLGLWLDAADTSSMTLSGSSVTQWRDKSVNQYVMTNNQGTTSISTASLNSLNTVYTPSGTNSKITNFVGRTKCTMFLVGKAAISRYLLAINGGFLYTGNDSLLYFQPPTGTYLDLVDSVSGVVVSNNTWFILCIGYDNATNNTANPYTINGTTRTTTITPRGTPGILTDQNITSTLYINSANGTNSYDSVYTAEILYYNNTLTTTQRQQVEGYLAHKWGLTGYYFPRTPLTIPGCQLWLDAADSSTTTSITSGIWTDKSGNNYNTSYVSGGSGFTLGTINTLPAVTFPGGANKVLTASVPTSTTSGFSIFFIASTSASSGTNTRYIANLTSTLQIYTISGTNTVASYVGATFPSTSLTISTGVPFILSLTVSSSTFSQWINGTANSSTGTTVSTSGSTIVIGGSGSYTTDLVFAGQIGELMIFNTALTTTQRQTIEDYLAKKWGFTSMYPAIPSTHPFYSVKPHLRAFNPTDISGCQLWLDAADASTVTGTTTVTQWRDKSGNGRNLGVGSGTTSYSSSAINLNSSYMLVNSPVNLTNVTVFIVSKSTGVTNQILLGAKPNTDFVYNSVDGFGFYNDPPTGRIRFYGQGDDIRQSIFFTDTSITKLYTFQSTGTTVSGWLNGTSQSGGTLTTTRTSTAQGFAIGAEWGGSSYQNIWVTASIYEIIVYNTALTTSQRQQVEGYLAHKWGLNLTYGTNTPLTIPGCQLWLDAADSSTITLSSSKVTQWNDKSVNGYNFTQATSGNQPTYSTASLNNSNTITFTSANSTFLTGTASTTFMGTNSISVYGVFKTNNNTSKSSVFSKSLYGSAAGRILYGFRESGTPATIAGGIGVASGPNAYTDISDSYTAGAWRVFGFVSDRSGWTNTTYQNGTSIGSITITANTSTNLTNAFPMLIGAYNNSSGSIPPQAGYYLDGAVAEIIVFSTALTTTQRQTIEGYLARKWGLTISNQFLLTHPFYRIPPASVVFSPLSISGVSLWLDGADQTSITLSGSSVTQWNDKSGNNKHAVGTVAPTYSSTSRYVLFNGSTQYFTLPDGTYPFGNTPYSIFIVAYTRNAGNPQWVICGGGESTNQALGLLFYYTNAVWHSWWINEYRFDNSITNNVPAIVNISYATSRSIIVNGGTASVNNPGSRSSTNSPNYIGRRPGGQFFDGGLAECIVFNSEISLSQRQQVEGYLAQKWGLTGSLPSTHPFKKIPA